MALNLLILPREFNRPPRFLVVTLQNLTYDLGGRALYEDISWQINPHDRVGLVGRNGCGKSTLLRLITRQLTPTAGSIVYSPTLKIAFLNQDLLSFKSNETILEVALQAFEEEAQMEAELERLAVEMAQRPDDMDLVLRYSELLERFQVLGGYEREARAHEVLAGLGFPASDHNRPFDEFSGGWRMRVLLARMLLKQPDLLLLDEPTNHLDLPSIVWVEQYMRQFKGAYIVVSHDRFFLDRVVEQVVEVANRKLHFYTGNYSHFLEERAERRQMQQAAYDNQQKQIAQTERNIDRFRAKASKATQAQSWMKQLEKLERIEAPESDTAVMNLRFRVSKQSGNDVLKLKGLSKSYGSLKVLDQTDAYLKKGDKIGLVGPNGIGKSTLLRVLQGSEPYEFGELNLGYNVEMSFYAQHQLESLTLTNTIWDEVYGSSPKHTDAQVRAVLGAFLFSGDEVNKKISVLSGGEKARVALAKTLLQESNLLLLDEPTNHLDMQSIDMLAEALQAYEGTFIVVSHDRHFLNRIANKIWYVDGRQLKEYDGPLMDFLDWLNRRQQQHPPSNGRTNGQSANGNGAPKTAHPPAPKAAETKATRPEDQKKIKQLNQQLRKLEEELAQHKQQLAALETQMAAPDVAVDFSRLSELQRQHASCQREQQLLQDRWDALFLEIAELEEA
jgi:ATP-binding cassette subfamily F protein 3